MSWRSGTLRQFDQTLLARAGIQTANRQILQFYPQAIEDQLAALEMEHARRSGHPHVEEFLRTIFGVASRGDEFEFQVIEQRFRPR